MEAEKKDPGNEVTLSSPGNVAKSFVTLTSQEEFMDLRLIPLFNSLEKLLFALNKVSSVVGSDLFWLSSSSNEST